MGAARGRLGGGRRAGDGAPPRRGRGRGEVEVAGLGSAAPASELAVGGAEGGPAELGRGSGLGAGRQAEPRRRKVRLVGWLNPAP